jgi:polysaccharide deacetylase 2 family uncharacterized protein YibQ
MLRLVYPSQVACYAQVLLDIKKIAYLIHVAVGEIGLQQSERRNFLTLNLAVTILLISTIEGTQESSDLSQMEQI